ncbi:MAG: cytochrome c3 family protein [Alphaproteobacteria bacterium]
MFGGPCDDGPHADGACSRSFGPCVPSCSVHHSRLLTRRRVTAAIIGLLVILLGGDVRHLSPGPLTTSHANIGECKACHSAATGGPFAWLDHVLDGADPARESARCQACHGTAYPLAPHHSPQAKRAKVHDTGNTVSFPPPPDVMKTTIACAVCHKEHGLADTSIGNDRCRPCHLQQFLGADAHAGFGPRPKEKFSYSFNHKKHFEVHYKDSAKKKGEIYNPEANCGDCHIVSAASSTFSLRTADLSCGSCHQNDFSGLGQGIPFLTVPGLDLEVLRRKGVAIGSWPEESMATLSPMMELLLAGDPALRQPLSSIRSLSLLDLTTATDEQLAGIRQVAWAVKGLLAELVDEGPPVLARRLRRSLDIDIGRNEVAMFATLPREAVAALRTAAFPDLDLELERHRAGEEVALPPPQAQAPAPQAPAPVPAAAAGDDDLLDGEFLPSVPSPQAPRKRLVSENWLAQGGWLRLGFVLAYRPLAHRDAFMRGWLDASSHVKDAPASDQWTSVVKQMATSDSMSKCPKCHVTALADVAPTGTVLRTPQFTAFSHPTHLSRVGDHDCLMCHPWGTPVSENCIGACEQEFLPVGRKICHACHKDSRDQDGCVLCHRYHGATAEARP